MGAAFICDYVRTPFGRYGGCLSAVRPDDLAAHTIRSLTMRNSQIDWTRLSEVIFGCANQAGEDNRNVARMAALIAGLPKEAPGKTVNRLCGSGMDAVIDAFRAIACGEADLIIAGGVESMSRAPFVMPKADVAFSRKAEVHDTTIGWRFINPALKAAHGAESMPETAENVAEGHNISRKDQDLFALRSQQRAHAAQQNGRFANEIIPISVPKRKQRPLIIDADEHPRADTTIDKLASLKAPFREGGTVTAGNSSGVNDGAAALLIAGEKAVVEYQLKPIARILGGASAGVAPRIMGIGPVPAVQSLCERLSFAISDFDVIEINEAFAAQALAVTRALGLPDAAAHINPNGGAIALGHPLGASGARITGTAALELALRKQRTALCAMCVGVGQGVAIALEAV